MHLSICVSSTVRFVDFNVYRMQKVMFIFLAGQIYMKNKTRFDLRLSLAMWSSLLAIFSIFGAIRVLPELIYAIYRHGIKYSICNNSNAFGVVGFW
jgi:elongation of very long chain fatty acids protein 6